MKKLIVAVGLCAFASPAFAQQAVAPSPSTLEVEQSRAAMLESQLRYFVLVLRDTEAKLQQKTSEATILSAWWADYVKGLSAAPAVGEKK